MTQPLLFELGGQELAQPAAKARTTDPQSSHEAAQRMNESGKVKAHNIICQALVDMKPGSTIHELAALSKAIHKAEALTHVQIARRLPYISTVERKGIRKCKVTGSKCQLWWPRD